PGGDLKVDFGRTSDGWADLLATAGQFSWPPAGRFVAVYGQFFMAANKRAALALGLALSVDLRPTA
ncbi:MAG TPA: hypothetical protein VFW71_04240, partial [Actinomycetota bacterium]|nr:hypothetical protein [Actinomycetota bacterium]